MGRSTAIFFGPAPWGHGEGSKGQISFNFNYKVNFKDFFIPNYVCVLTNERNKIYQTGFLFWSLGHALGVGLGVLRGQNLIPSCCMSVMLSPLKPLDEIQPNLVCELLSWMERATAIFGPDPWGPGEGSKGQISFNFNYKVNFKEFIPNFVCVLTNERSKTYQSGFSFCCLGHAPGVGLWGDRGAQVVKNLIFSNMVMLHIKSTRMTSRTECK